MKALGGFVVAASLLGGPAAGAQSCSPNSCQYGSDACYSENSIICQGGARLQCHGGSWSAMTGDQAGCSAVLRTIRILEVTIQVKVPAQEASPGVPAVPARDFQDTIAPKVASLCNYMEACSFVPRDLYSLERGSLAVLRLRYACRDRATNSVDLYGPAPPNDGKEDLVYNLDCLGQPSRRLSQ